jgi:ribosomal small subunit protein bTHX
MPESYANRRRISTRQLTLRLRFGVTLVSYAGIFKKITRRQIQMGRGDRKTRKGKTAIRSYGNARSHKATATKAGAAVKKTAAHKPAAKKAAPAVKKAAAKKAG